jgi:hypothetical protein
MQKQYKVAENDKALQAECVAQYLNYDELTDGRMFVLHDKVIEITVSSSEQHLIYRIDEYQSDEHFTDIRNAIDDKFSFFQDDALALVDTFYLVEKTDVVEYLNDQLMSDL